LLDLQESKAAEADFFSSPAFDELGVGTFVDDGDTELQNSIDDFFSDSRNNSQALSQDPLDLYRSGNSLIGSPLPAALTAGVKLEPFQCPLALDPSPVLVAATPDLGNAPRHSLRQAAQPTRRLVAGYDSTNTRNRRSAPTRSPQKKENASKTKPSSRKAKAPRDSGNQQSASAKKARQKMPIAEQKRRNCESAKRSRIKKQIALQQATQRADLAEQQNRLLRERFDALRNWAYKMGVHLAAHKDCKDCALLRQQQQLEQLLTSPVTSPQIR
jgi:hypothetical protein